ncbi:hypothetical protein [Novosphingobium sp. PC22D]|uniref:hypothetical protein n=1 Tax=Novosphingobium sp. PC22D TaxID=1962403 RepID=UPI001145F55A|nr:hypothetical protein [Novosphingobium sp. PC22D]
MSHAEAGTAGRLLIDSEAAADLSIGEIRDAVLPLIRSNIYRVDVDKQAIEIDGPDVSHQLLDPDLEDGLRWLGVGSGARSRFDFREQRSRLMLALEDSWCGVFLANHLATLRSEEPLTIIHLDDHTDMMSTLLVVEQSADGSSALEDPLTGVPFDPASPADWHSAITSGAITIGSFLTPFFALDRIVEVFHLKADLEKAETFAVAPHVVDHDLLAGYRFHAIELGDSAADANPKRLYRRSNDAHELLAQLAEDRRAAIHIDLDYFLNDYNGNAWQVGEIDMVAMRKSALERLDHFFSAFDRSGISIACWMIGVSPGFCSARHWRFLIEEIERRITDLEASPARHCTRA